MEVNYIFEGTKFMVLGMTTVFSFLLLMIYVLKLQEKILKKFFPPKTKPAAPAAPAVSKPAANDDAQVIAAITAAITDFKKR